MTAPLTILLPPGHARAHTAFLCCPCDLCRAARIQRNNRWDWAFAAVCLAGAAVCVWLMVTA